MLSSICWCYHIISICIISIRIPFNPCSIKSRSWFRIIINGNTRIHNIGHARWLPWWLFGVENTGPLLAFLPVITIGLLFGLAIDYELFLMTRVHEEYSKTGDNDHSIRVGIKESGPVIVAAALIMFSVFIAFVFQDDMQIKSMGISLAFGVLFDAFVVRMTLIPALTKLFGKDHGIYLNG